MILETINSTADLKKIPRNQLSELAKEIRQQIIDVVLKNGGHLASNLGVVELTIALHRVFDSPKDAIVWDVGHQCYAHKLLTGRCKNFTTIRTRGGISGFPKSSESEHDFFDTGHASTSISSALGLLMARDISHADGKVIAVIGDGALTGGMAFEALSHAGQLSKNLIVVLNDNQMSIDHNTGSVSRYLSRLTMTAQYQTVRYKIDRLVDRIPYFNKHIEKFIFRFKRALKGLLLTNNLFVDLGFEYVGPLNGHDEQGLENVLRRVEKLQRPVVVHVITKKGKGYKPAEECPEHYHGVSAAKTHARPNTNNTEDTAVVATSRTYTQAFGKAIVGLAEKRNDVVAITAAMAQGTGLSEFEKRFPERFFDVGIAEEHAITFAAGLAKGKMLPVVCIYSTFIQRAIDQIVEDLALPSAHSIIMLDRAGAVPDDGETHQGIFDIAMIRSIPNVIMISPTTEKDLELCLSWASSSVKCPVVMRYAKANCATETDEFSKDLVLGQGVLVKAESYAENLIQNDMAKKILLACTGGMYAETLIAARSLLLDNIYADIYSLRFIKPIDEKYFVELAKNYDGVLIAEDGVETGGIAEFLRGVLYQHNYFNVAVKAMPEKFYAHSSRKEIFEDAKISAQSISETAKLL